jgi:hypothetical protein
MPSLALKQLIVAQESALASAQPKSVERSNIAKKLAILRKQAADEDAAAAKKVVAVAPAKKEPQAKEVMNGELRNCAACSSDFYLRDHEKAFYTEKGFALPTRCFHCRKQRQAAKAGGGGGGGGGPQPQQIECQTCHSEFVHSIGAQRHFEENGWAAPVRCVDCRHEKKAMGKLSPFPINCGECHEDFTFSVAQQIHFKKEGWEPPVRCVACRKAKKEAAATAAAAAAAAAVAAEADVAKNTPVEEKPAE